MVKIKMGKSDLEVEFSMARLLSNVRSLYGSQEYEGVPDDFDISDWYVLSRYSEGRLELLNPKQFYYVRHLVGNRKPVDLAYDLEERLLHLCYDYSKPMLKRYVITMMSPSAKRDMETELRIRKIMEDIGQNEEGGAKTETDIAEDKSLNSSH